MHLRVLFALKVRRPSDDRFVLVSAHINQGGISQWHFISCLCGGVAEWLRRSFASLVRSIVNHQLVFEISLCGEILERERDPERERP